MEKEIIFADKMYRALCKNKGVDASNSKYYLYHGTAIESFTPTYGFGEDKHDYGRGFYLTLELDLAREWAICTDNSIGYVHKYWLDTSNLSILDFNEHYSVLTWLATLASHRHASSGKKHVLNETKLIEKYYKPEIKNYDVIVGYRADDSFFSFAKRAIKGEVDICLLDGIMHSGELGYQIFLQSEKAFKALKEIKTPGCDYFEAVSKSKYYDSFERKDSKARQYVADLIESDKNTLTDTIEKYL